MRPLWGASGSPSNKIKGENEMEMNERYIKCVDCGEEFLSYCEEFHVKCNTCEPVKEIVFKELDLSQTCTECGETHEKCECLPF